MRVVGLLRGVNVGGSNRLKMADLRAVVESLGHTEVDTYLQSGNVVFTAQRLGDRLGDEISEQLRETCGIDVLVLTRTGAEMAAIVAANPYERDDPTKVVVTFRSSSDTSNHGSNHTSNHSSNLTSDDNSNDTSDDNSHDTTHDSSDDSSHDTSNRALPDLDLAEFAPEGLTLSGREMYLDLPFGQGRSRLTAALATRDDGCSTSRNWRTVLALAAMSAARTD